MTAVSDTECRLGHRCCSERNTSDRNYVTLIREHNKLRASLKDRERRIKVARALVGDISTGSVIQGAKVLAAAKALTLSQRLDEKLAKVVLRRPLPKGGRR